MSNIKQIPQTGQLLVAEPFMADDNFKRAVLLLCNHTQEEGTIGLVLNKKLEYRLSDAIPELSYFDVPLYYGGPVRQDTLHFLHNYGHIIQGSVKITDKVFWGGNFEHIKLHIEAGTIKPENIRFYVGYSGWDPNQLVEEMKTQSWIVANNDKSYVYAKDPKALWRQVLLDMGGDYRIMANFPKDPQLN